MPKPLLDHNKLWKILKEMGIPDHLTCLLRNLYAGQEATVRTGHDTTLMAESEEELKSLLMKAESWLKAQLSENEDHGIQSHHSMGNRW